MGQDRIGYPPESQRSNMMSSGDHQRCPRIEETDKEATSGLDEMYLADKYKIITLMVS